MRLPLQLGFLSACTIGVAFAFQWYVMTSLGPGMETDALFAGMTIPQLVLAVVSDSLMHVLVPLLAGEDAERSRRDAWGFAALVGGLFALLSLVLAVGAPWWVPLTVPGFTPAGQALVVVLTRIQLIGMVFTAVIGVQWALAHARRRFLWAETAPLLANACALCALVWALPRYGVISAAWIATFRLGLQALLLSPILGRPVRVNLGSPAISRAWQRIKPLLIGTAYYKTDPMFERFFLSMGGSGSLSLYYLAQQIYGAAAQILNRAVVAPVVPALSCLFKEGATAQFRRLYVRKVLEAGLLGLGALLVIVLFGERVLGLLIGHRNITAENVTHLWWIMIWLGGMFVGGVVGQVSSSSFYALGDTATPTRLGVYTYSAYLPLKIALFYAFGVAGLASATSLFLVANFLLQHQRLQAKLR